VTRICATARLLNYSPSRICAATRLLNYSSSRICAATRLLNYSPSRICAATRLLNYSPSRICATTRLLNYSPSRICATHFGHVTTNPPGTSPSPFGRAEDELSSSKYDWDAEQFDKRSVTPSAVQREVASTTVWTPAKSPPTWEQENSPHQMLKRTEQTNKQTRGASRAPNRPNRAGDNKQTRREAQESHSHLAWDSVSPFTLQWVPSPEKSSALVHPEYSVCSSDPIDQDHDDQVDDQHDRHHDDHDRRNRDHKHRDRGDRDSGQINSRTHQGKAATARLQSAQDSVASSWVDYADYAWSRGLDDGATLAGKASPSLFHWHLCFTARYLCSGCHAFHTHTHTHTHTHIHTHTHTHTSHSILTFTSITICRRRQRR
jgi:hypothetical protein